MRQKIYTGGTGIIVHSGGKILMGERSDGQGWAIAGGKVDPGETFLETAVREAREEFGIIIYEKDMELCGAILCIARIHGIMQPVRSVIFKYNAGASPDKVYLTDHDKEMRGLTWMTPTQIMTTTDGNIFPPTLIALNKFWPDFDVKFNNGEVVYEGETKWLKSQ